MYNIDEVFTLINNLDTREALRKFGPQWSIVVVDERLQIVDVSRFKYMPSVAQAKDLMSQHEDCVYFYCQPGDYDSIEKLRLKVESCKEAFLVD